VVAATVQAAEAISAQVRELPRSRGRLEHHARRAGCSLRRQRWNRPDLSPPRRCHLADPYGFASAAELSLFRRPLPSANLRFLSQIMAYTAKRSDDAAGDLACGGARAGEQVLVSQDFRIGITDAATSGFNQNVFTLFPAWSNADSSTEQGRRRASIARGERIFNGERFRIRGVGGLRDQQGTCSTCHDTRTWAATRWPHR
jgi:hypothetical protein